MKRTITDLINEIKDVWFDNYIKSVTIEQDKKEAYRKSSIWHRILWRVREWDNRLKYMLWYEYCKLENRSWYVIWLYISIIDYMMLFWIWLFIGNACRWPMLIITICNKNIINRQREKSRRLYKLLTYKL
mgnify:CR=1 FL=1